MDFELKNWDKIDYETAKFTLDQAEKYLNSTIRTAENHHRRASTVLRAIISLIILLVAFLSSGYSESKLLIHLSIIGLGILIILMFDTFSVYNQYKNQPIGNLPSNILREDVLDFSKNENHDLKLTIIYRSLIRIQNMIIDNEARNEATHIRIHRLYSNIKLGLIFIIFYPFLVWSLYLFGFLVVVL